MQTRSSFRCDKLGLHKWIKVLRLRKPQGRAERNITLECCSRCGRHRIAWKEPLILQDDSGEVTAYNGVKIDNWMFVDDADIDEFYLAGEIPEYA